MAPRRRDAPARWLGARSLRTAAAKRSEAAVPSAIRGLAGFRKASTVFSGEVDRGVYRQNPALASRATVLPGLDARLIFVDRATNSDKYYVLQGLEDPKARAGKPRCFAYQRWGRTGTGGICRIQGPMEQEEAQAHLFRIFKGKTGVEWGDLRPGQETAPGKHWLVAPSDADPGARWEYCVNDDAGGPARWCPYDADTVRKVEELYAEHEANPRSRNHTAKRFVRSGSFTYSLDLDSLTQRNMKTNKERRIRRVSASTVAEASDPGIPRSPLNAPTAHATLLRRGTSETIPAVLDEDEKASIPELPEVEGVASASSIGAAVDESQAQLQRKPSTLGEMCVLVRSGEVSKLPKMFLKDWLRRHKISATGSKTDLVVRICALVW